MPPGRHRRATDGTAAAPTASGSGYEVRTRRSGTAMTSAATRSTSAEENNEGLTSWVGVVALACFTLGIGRLSRWSRCPAPLTLPSPEFRHDGSGLRGSGADQFAREVVVAVLAAQVLGLAHGERNEGEEDTPDYGKAGDDRRALLRWRRGRRILERWWRRPLVDRLLVVIAGI